MRAMIDDEFVFAHRSRGLSPDHPFIRGAAQNPDIYFQGRETVNRFYRTGTGDHSRRDGPLRPRRRASYKLYEY